MASRCAVISTRTAYTACRRIIQTNEILSTQQKLSTYNLVIHQLPVATVEQVIRKSTYWIQFGMKPHRDTRNGGDGVTTLE
jgi:hypothetical protein